MLSLINNMFFFSTLLVIFMIKWQYFQKRLHLQLQKKHEKHYFNIFFRRKAMLKIRISSIFILSYSLLKYLN